MRLHQEMVLGVGGTRALRALGIEPRAWHLNEGHSAFMLVERTRELLVNGMSMDEALERVKSNAVFTIHTPVSAGNERFDANLVRRLAAPLVADSGLDLERIVERGRRTDNDAGQFDMPASSLRTTNGANAVSHLHAQTANATWSGVIAQPILGITNGVHPPSWIGGPARALDETLGADLDNLDEVKPFWDDIAKLPDAQLWDAHRRQKLELAYFCRRRLQSQFARHCEAPRLLEDLSQALDPEVLTIGFARPPPPLRDLQARGADLLRRGAPGQDPAQRRASGPGRLRRQGAPRRPPRPARHPGHLQPQPITQVR